MWIESKNNSLASSRVTLKSTHTSFSAAQGGLEAMGLENDSLTQKLDDCTTANLMVISKYFENSLKKVEHFYPPLHVLREQIRPDQMLKDGEVVSLLG